MCDICNGMTQDHLVDRTRGHIESTGWALQGVEPDAGGPGCVYSIGLLSSYDHPELLIVDDDVARGASLLNALGRAIRDGAIIEPGDELDLGGCEAELIDIHPTHLRDGLMAMWDVAGHHGPDGEPLELEAYQVLVPGPMPGGDRLPDVRLDGPGPALSGAGPNRAARRAGARRHWR